jgi:large subunit ribosomal protein L18
MKTLTSNIAKRQRRHARIRAKIFGTNEKPRLSVFKSNKHLFVQLIDDQNGLTLASVHSREVKGKSMTEKAHLVGTTLATKAKIKKIEKVVFDRGGFMYTGNIKAVAEGAREGGLKF